MRTITVREIMSTNLVTLEEEETVDLAEKAMAHGRIRHLPVTRDERLVGLVTHRDLLRAQVSSLADIPPREKSELKLSILARDIMQREVTCVHPDTTVLEAARILKENKFGCLPVVEDGRLVGIITEADFIDLVIRALEDHEE